MIFVWSRTVSVTKAVCCWGDMATTTKPVVDNPDQVVEVVKDVSGAVVNVEVNAVDATWWQCPHLEPW